MTARAQSADAESIAASPGEGRPGLGDLVSAEAEGMANTFAMLRLKGELSLRLLLAGVGLCIFAGLAFLAACGLAMVSLIVYTGRLGLPPELGFLLGALLCIGGAWVCWRRAGGHFREATELLSVTFKAPEKRGEYGLQN